MIRAISLVCAGALALGGCVYIDADGANIDGHDWSHDGGFYGAEVTVGDEIVMTAASNGCTSKADFAADVDHDHGVYEVEFERIKPDHCKAYIPEGVKLSWTYQELDIPPGARVVVEHFARR